MRVGNQIAITGAVIAMLLGFGVTEVGRARAQQPGRMPLAELQNYVGACAGNYLWQSGESSPETQKAIDLIMEVKHVDRRKAIDLMYDGRDERLFQQLQGHADAADPHYAEGHLAQCETWTGIPRPKGEVRVLPMPWTRPKRQTAELDKDHVRNCAGMYAFQDPASPSTLAAIALQAEVAGISVEEARAAAVTKGNNWRGLVADGTAKPVEVANIVRKCSYWIDIPVPEGTPPFGEWPTETCDAACENIQARMKAIEAASAQGRTLACVEGEKVAAAIMEPYYAQGAEAIKRYNNSLFCTGGECYGGDVTEKNERRTAMCKAFTRAIGAIPSQCSAEYRAMSADRDRLDCRG